MLGVTLGSLYVDAQGYVPVLLENLRDMSCSGTFWLLGGGWLHWEDPEGWGIHVNPWLIHVNVWQKPLQYGKVISLQPIKINGKKKKKSEH